MYTSDPLFALYVFLSFFGLSTFIFAACIGLDNLSSRNRWEHINFRNHTLDERKAFVLENVIIKKVLKKGGGNDVMFPHEIELSTGSVTDLTDVEEGDGDSGKIEDTIKTPSNERKKENLMIESLREWRSSLQGIDDDSTSSSLCSPKRCTICIQQYKDGDAICWSPNKKCFHVYHLSCMIHWLLEHDDCPICRQNFLMDGDGTMIHSSE